MRTGFSVSRWEPGINRYSGPVSVECDFLVQLEDRCEQIQEHLRHALHSGPCGRWQHETELLGRESPTWSLSWGVCGTEGLGFQGEQQCRRC